MNFSSRFPVHLFIINLSTEMFPARFVMTYPVLLFY